MAPNSSKKRTSRKRAHGTRVAARVLEDGSIVELLYEPSNRETWLCVFKDGRYSIEPQVKTEAGEILSPIDAGHALVRHQAVLLPAQPIEYESKPELLASIREYIHRYVDLDETFEAIAAHYVLLSWVYDAFNELPYLRLRGDYGTGKTRALIVIGSILYRPFFASGASTVSPIFHTLDTFRGSLVFDEADFRFSDEKAELVKILNNGNVRGMPVLRTMLNSKREFAPVAFQVFGPKLLATRGTYDDVALESRFVTETMGSHPLRRNIPINLPDRAFDEAAELRGKLLLYRFHYLHGTMIDTNLLTPNLEARINQILLPLLSVVDDRTLQDAIVDRACAEQDAGRASRGLSVEAHIVESLIQRIDAGPEGAIALKLIVADIRQRHGTEYERPVTNRYIGSVIRSRLGLHAYKTSGIFVIPPAEFPKVWILAERFGIESDAANLSDSRDVGT